MKHVFFFLFFFLFRRRSMESVRAGKSGTSSGRSVGMCVDVRIDTCAGMCVRRCRDGAPCPHPSRNMVVVIATMIE